MANLRITEFHGIGKGHGQSDIQAAVGPPSAEQVVAIGGSSTASNAFSPQTIVIRVHAEAICAVYVGGTTPVATAGTSARFVAGQTEYFRVAGGDKLAVITDT